MLGEAQRGNSRLKNARQPCNGAGETGVGRGGIIRLRRRAKASVWRKWEKHCGDVTMPQSQKHYGGRDEGVAVEEHCNQERQKVRMVLKNRKVRGKTMIIHEMS